MDEAIDNFQTITGYDLSGLLTVMDVFFTKQVPILQGYYSGKLDKAPSTTVKLLAKLQLETNTVLNLYRQYQVRFKTLLDWELLTIIEEFRTKLDTVANMPKYLRSARIGAGFTTTPTATVVVPTTSTIEHVLRNAGGDPYAHDNWVVLATSQDIQEESYGPDAEPISVQIPVGSARGFQLLSVLGYPAGAEAQGRDLNRRLTFVDDDLEALTPDATQLQSFDVLLNLRKEDIPEYANMGLDGIIGLNQATATYRLPAIIRQLSDTFATDDTFVGVQITKLQIVADSTQLEITANTVYGLIQPKLLAS